MFLLITFIVELTKKIHQIIYLCKIGQTQEFSHANNSENKKNSHNNNEREFFEIFGIKLYFDDILIVCLLYFLYKEDVHDEMLFLALILLLIS